MILLFIKNILLWKTGQPNIIGSIILSFIISSSLCEQYCAHTSKKYFLKSENVTNIESEVTAPTENWLN